MDNIYYVYAYIDPRNEKIFYIGKGKSTRMYVHLRSGMLKTDTPKNNLIKEILNNGLKPKIIKLEKNLTEKEALAKEIEWIKKIGKDNLTNKTIGGQGVSGLPSPFKGKYHSEEAKQKMRESKLGSLNPQYGKPRSEEALNKFIDKMSGKNHPFYGKKRDKETKQKISQKLKGTELTEEQKQQRSKTMKNLWNNNQFKRKQFQGCQNPNYKKLEDEIINKIIDYYQNKKYSIFKISKELTISRFKIQSILIEHGLIERK